MEEVLEVLKGDLPDCVRDFQHVANELARLGRETLLTLLLARF